MKNSSQRFEEEYAHAKTREREKRFLSFVDNGD